MTAQVFRPMQVEILFSPERHEKESVVWVLDTEAALRLSGSLEQGEFPIELLPTQAKTTSAKQDRLLVTAQGFSMRGPCETRVIGFHRRHRTRPLHLALFVVQFANDPSYRVLKVLDAKWSEHYRVEVNPDGVTVLELISGHPRARINRSRDGDTVVWQVD